MQQQIREQSTMPTTKHDLVALAKKLRPNLDREPQPSLRTRTHLTAFTSAQPEQSDAYVASFLKRWLQEKGLLLLLWKKKPQRGAISEEIPQY